VTKQKVKFLTAVWGDSYIRRFCELSLPSFVASGNIPALAEGRDFEVVIMTREVDFPVFDDYPAMARLRNTCPVRFVSIDDLMGSKVYGVILTIAYARPIIAMGEEMLNTQFVFMNADFILADGSLRSLAHRIDSGERVILGPSFRSVSEEVEPVLENLVDRESGVLSVKPREMVKIAMDAVHPTKFAKIQNQSFIGTKHPNQAFWEIDDQTMLGRYFLIFMLSLKPESIMSSVSSYCDYALIADLCPDCNQTAMTDSDEFFMLELQEEEKESILLYNGRPYDAKKTAKSLSKWTTIEHLKGLDHNVVFHSRDVPPDAVRYIAEADRFVETVKKTVKARAHKNHWHWLYGVAAWKTERLENTKTALPKEIGNVKSPLLYWTKAKLRKVMLSITKKVKIFLLFDSYWIIRKLGDRISQNLKNKKVTNLLLSSKNAAHGSIIFDDQFGEIKTRPIKSYFSSASKGHENTGVGIVLVSCDCSQVTALIERFVDHISMARNCEVHLFAFGGEFDNLELLSAIRVARRLGMSVEIASVGGAFSSLEGRLSFRATGWFSLMLKLFILVPSLFLRFIAVRILREDRVTEGLSAGSIALAVELKHK